MPRNGSGDYSLPVNSWNPAVNGTPATAADWQVLIDDVRQAITQSVSRDGQTPITQNIPMGGNKFTGLSAGTAAGDSVRFEQMFSQGQPQDLASAATTDIGAQLTTNLNITGTTTITSLGTNYNGPRYLRFAGALTLTHSASLVLPAGTDVTTIAGDVFLATPVGVPASGWSVRPLSNIATTAQAQALTDDSRLLTPKKLNDAFKGANQVLTLSYSAQKLPGNFMIKVFGAVNNNLNGSGFSQTSFPEPFPTECVGVFGIPQTGPGAAYAPFQLAYTAYDKNSFAWIIYDAAGVPIPSAGAVVVRFVAFGY